MPRRQPRRPSIGFCSCSRSTASSRRCFSSTSGPVSPFASASVTSTSSFSCLRQELVQRRVDQADDDRQAVHRLRGCRRSRRSGSRRGAPARRRYVCASLRHRRAWRPARRGSSPERCGGRPSSRNMCSVRHEADAGGAERARARGLVGSVGVGPDAEACASRRPSQQRRQLFSRWKSGSIVAIRPANTSPVPAVERDPVAFGRASCRRTRERARVDVDLDAARRRRCTACPSGARRPPRGWTMPPREVRMPAARRHAVEVLGRGLAARQHHRLAVGGQLGSARSGSKTTLPTAAPGDAARPLPSGVTSRWRARLRSNCGTSELLEWLGSTRLSASSLSISPSPTMSTAVTTAARRCAWRCASAACTACCARR